MKRRAFTLVELLVVIAVIALLLSILMPALRLAKDKAMVVYCGNNIKQQLLAFMIYGQDYNNKVFGDIGWLDGTDRWKYRLFMKYLGMNTEGSIVDETIPITQEDIKAPDIFYCPSNVSRSGSRRQSYWDFGGSTRASWRIIAYLWILENDPWVTRKEPVWGNDNKIWVTRLDVGNPYEAELITDVAYQDALTLEFDIIMSGSSQGSSTGMPETSSHIKSSEKLFGANIGFCDGSVRWRNFSEMKPRFRWGGVNGSGPINWW